MSIHGRHGNRHAVQSPSLLPSALCPSRVSHGVCNHSARSRTHLLLSCQIWTPDRRPSWRPADVGASNARTSCKILARTHLHDAHTRISIFSRVKRMYLFRRAVKRSRVTGVPPVGKTYSETRGGGASVFERRAALDPLSCSGAGVSKCSSRSRMWLQRRRMSKRTHTHALPFHTHLAKWKIMSCPLCFWASSASPSASERATALFPSTSVVTFICGTVSG